MWTAQRAMSAIPPQSIRAQVDRIVASEAFVRSHRMQRFLRFVVEETLAGRADQLGEYAIGVAVFDRGQDFEPALDPIVRNDARRLRLKLIEYYGHDHPAPDDQVRIEIPKGGYVPAFAPTPARDSKSENCRLGVFPFDELTVADGDACCGRSLCMSLTARLTSLDGVEAVAHSYLAGQSVRDAATEFRLSHIIQGSFAISNRRCRAVLNLIHASDGVQIWAREYDFQLDERLGVPSEIVGSVVQEVAARLGVPRVLRDVTRPGLGAVSLWNVMDGRSNRAA